MVLAFMVPPALADPSPRRQHSLTRRRAFFANPRPECGAAKWDLDPMTSISGITRNSDALEACRSLPECQNSLQHPERGDPADRVAWTSVPRHPLDDPEHRESTDGRGSPGQFGGRQAMPTKWGQGPLGNILVSNILCATPSTVCRVCRRFEVESSPF